MCYTYKTKIGTFFIRRLTDVHWGLHFEEKLLGSYASPASAAESVYNQKTDYSEWDTLEKVTKPRNISEWKEVC
jgi:hypothetical protein